MYESFGVFKVFMNKLLIQDLSKFTLEVIA